MRITISTACLATLWLGLGFCSWLGCAQTTIPRDALALREPTTEIRMRQSRRYETSDERAILIASNQLLQDLGFNLEESSREVGLLVASKDRTAVDSGQVAGQVMAAFFLGVRIPIDKDQKIRASVVTAPSADGSQTLVRVTFQRLVWNDLGALQKVERLDASELYLEFFEKLSKALFLEAQEVG
jgi:hypothetical protein